MLYHFETSMNEADCRTPDAGYRFAKRGAFADGQTRLILRSAKDEALLPTYQCGSLGDFPRFIELTEKISP
jgi:hypothetical protein